MVHLHNSGSAANCGSAKAMIASEKYIDVCFIAYNRGFPAIKINLNAFTPKSAETCTSGEVQASMFQHEPLPLQCK
jgi:hypothetical protein